MRVWGFCRRLLGVILLVMGAPVLATDPPPLSLYGDLPGIEDAAISPNGKNLAIIGRVKGQRQLLVLDAEHKPLAVIPAGEAKLRDLRWVGDDTVIILTSVTQTLDPIFLASKTELFGVLVIPLDGTKPWMVFEQTQGVAKNVMGDFGTRLIGGKWQGFFSGTAYANSVIREQIIGSTHVLFSVDMKTANTRKIAEMSGQDHRRTWLVDENGLPAATFDMSRTTGRWTISNARGATVASGVNPDGQAAMACLGKDGTTVIYGAENDKGDETFWFEVPLTGGMPTRIFENLNIDRLYIDRTNGHLLGFLENGEPTKATFFAAAQQTVMRKIYRAFPKLHVDVRDWTPDFSHLLVRTSGNGDSGSWYIVDMQKLSADPIGSERPLILPDLVGPISTIAYKAADGTDLDGILTLPPGRAAKDLPVIMFPHGGPTAHDSPIFEWWAQAFASRGYAVFQPNFRGSDNRDENFVHAGFGQWGRKMQSDVSDGLAELARRGIVDPKRACIMGGSYGGYAALAGVTLQHGLYRCAVAVAPVTDLKDFYSTRTNESGDSPITWKSMRRTLGNPSTFDEVSPRRHAAEADAPILLIHGKDDTVVPFSHSTAMAGALKAAGKPNEMVVLREEDHWLSRAATRKQMLEAAVAFVEKNNPAN